MRTWVSFALPAARLLDHTPLRCVPQAGLIQFADCCTSASTCSSLMLHLSRVRQQHLQWLAVACIATCTEQVILQSRCFISATTSPACHMYVVLPYACSILNTLSSRLGLVICQIDKQSIAFCCLCSRFCQSQQHFLSM